MLPARRGLQELSISGHMYMAGYAGIEVGLPGGVVSVGVEGTAAMLMSFGGNPRTDISAFGLQTTIATAPYISLLSGWLIFDLSAGVSSSTSILIDIRSEKDYTIAVKSTVNINAADMITNVLPGIPEEVKETLSTLFNVLPIKEVDFYAAGKDDKWWGLSMVVAGPIGIGAFLGESAGCACAPRTWHAWVPPSPHLVQTRCAVHRLRCPHPPTCRQPRLDRQGGGLPHLQLLHAAAEHRGAAVRPRPPHQARHRLLRGRQQDAVALHVRRQPRLPIGIFLPGRGDLRQVWVQRQQGHGRRAVLRALRLRM